MSVDDDGYTFAMRVGPHSGQAAGSDNCYYRKLLPLWFLTEENSPEEFSDDFCGLSPNSR
jgi:hypothetical protein